MFARNCVGASAWATSAYKAWYAIPSSHRFTTTPRPGSLVYFDEPDRVGEAGHVVFMVDNGYCYSNDILRRGKIDKVPLTLIHDKWGMRKLGWIDWTPSGAINLKPLPAPTGVVKLSDLVYGRYSTSAAIVNKALAAEGLLAPSLVRGYWSDAASHALRLFRNAGNYADNYAALVALGKKRGFTVVA
jgi:hypothetical protein